MKLDGSDAKAATGKKIVTARSAITDMESEISKALPRHMDIDAFTRKALSAISNNPKLGFCDPRSIVSAVMTAAALGLEVNTPLQHAFIIPYKDKAQFQMGYQGMIDLAYRSGLFKIIYAMEVYKTDEFYVQYGTDPKIMHVPSDDQGDDPIKYYAVYSITNGGLGFKVWSMDKVVEHARKTSEPYRRGSGPWVDWFDAMARKTVLRDLLKTAPKSVEMHRALAADGAIKEVRGDKGNFVFQDRFESAAAERDVTSGN